MAVDSYDEVAEAFAEETEGVEKAKMFGSDGLRVGKKFFASLSKGRFVVKLPRERVDELVDKGEGERFDPGSGRAMKEWVVVVPESEAAARGFLREALAFVRATAV